MKRLIFLSLLRSCKNLFFSFLIFCSFSLVGQTTRPFAQNTTGSSGLQTGYSLSYSVGELSSIAFFEAFNSSTLSTGFFQSFTPIITAINDLKLNNNNQLSISPNPVQNIFKIKIFFPKIGELQIQIIDNLSNQKYISSSLNIQGNFEKIMNIENYPPGVYYVKFLFKETQGVSQCNVYKIIKL